MVFIGYIVYYCMFDSLDASSVAVGQTKSHTSLHAVKYFQYANTVVVFDVPEPEQVPGKARTTANTKCHKWKPKRWRQHCRTSVVLQCLILSLQFVKL